MQQAQGVDRTRARLTKMRCNLKMAATNIAPPCPTVHCVYRIVNFRNGKVYVGQTQYEHGRYQWHFEALKNAKHHSKKLQAAYSKYGDTAFYFEVVERDITSDKIDEREIYWIAYYDSFRNGYNMTLGGQCSGGNFKAIMWGGVEYESIQTVSDVSGLTVGEIRVGLIRKGYIKPKNNPAMARNGSAKLDDKPLPTRKQLIEMAQSLGLLEKPNPKQQEMALRYKRDLEWILTQNYPRKAQP